MNKALIPFFLTFLAGSATLLGILPTYGSQKEETIIPHTLSFSAGVMISISCFSLIPEAFLYVKQHHPLLEILFIIIEIFLGIYISKGISIFINHKKESKLYKISIITTLALILHNIPEGMITFLLSKNNLHLGILLSLAIACHNIPEGIAISIPLYYATRNHKKVFFYTFIAGFSELLGAFIAYFILGKTVSSLMLSSLLSITAGIMIFVSLEELLKTAKTYQNKHIKFSFLLGFVFMFLIQII